MTPTQGHIITIEVSLITDDPSAAFIEVRVEDHVKARAVNFINGKTGYVAFELIDPPVSIVPVGTIARELDSQIQERLGSEK